MVKLVYLRVQTDTNSVAPDPERANFRTVILPFIGREMKLSVKVSLIYL